MTIKSNKELQQAVNDAIKESGVTKTHIAKKLGISRQAFYKMMTEKETFSLDDANSILALIGMTTDTVIKKDY